MGMNELGPRRCPFAFASVILKKEVIIEKEKQRREPYAAHLEKTDGGQSPKSE